MVQIHDNVMWDWQCSAKYYMKFLIFGLNVGNIRKYYVEDRQPHIILLWVCLNHYGAMIRRFSIYQGRLTLEPHVNFKLFKKHEGPWGRMSSLCTVLRGRTMHRTIYVWVQVPTIATYGNRWQFIWFVTVGYFDIRPTFFDEPIAIQSVDPKSQPHDATWISHLIKSILSPRPSHSSVKWSQTVPGFSANHIICNARVKGPQAQVQSDPKSTYILSCDQGR